MDDRRALLTLTTDLAAEFLDTLPDRPVHAQANLAELRAAFGDTLPDDGTDAATVVRELTAAAEPGLVASAGPRYFGFVIGGALPAAHAADWLTTTWDQNAAIAVTSPSAAVVEEVAGAWLLELLGLPASCSFGFVTGAQMANVVALAAARHHVLATVGWDVEANGLTAAPPVAVLVGQRRHATIDLALRMLGLGAGQTTVVAADDQGRMRADRLADALGGERGPVIVCAQAGEINSGGFDPFGPICEAAHEVGAWVHVDGAFGLWAAVSERHRPLVEGVERADSWATDAHKWLNVPYDSGLVVTRHPTAHRGAFALEAAYLPQSSTDGLRDPDEWVPELSRRARGFAVWAALRQLGRAGVAEVVDRCCAHARRFADGLRVVDGVEVLNAVVLNQVLVRFGDSDEHTNAVIQHIQDDGTCWMGGTEWAGKRAMRISVSNWSTTEDDVDRSLDAIRRAHTEAGA